jgi:hypothetical protein
MEGYHFYVATAGEVDFQRHYLGVLQVRDDSGDTDPHGIFRYVKTERWRDLDIPAVGEKT